MKSHSLVISHAGGKERTKRGIVMRQKQKSSTGREDIEKKENNKNANDKRTSGKNDKGIIDRG